MSDHSGNRAPTAQGEARLHLRRKATRGFGAGALIAAAVFVRYALLPGTNQPLGLYVGLAVVLGLSTGALATALLVWWRAHRFAREQ